MRKKVSRFIILTGWALLLSSILIPTFYLLFLTQYSETNILEVRLETPVILISIWIISLILIFLGIILDTKSLFRQVLQHFKEFIRWIVYSVLSISLVFLLILLRHLQEKFTVGIIVSFFILIVLTVIITEKSFWNT